MSSLVASLSVLYGVPHKLRTHTPRWFLELRCRTSDRQPTSSRPSTWEKDEDEDRRKGKQLHSGDERNGCPLTADDTPE